MARFANTSCSQCGEDFGPGERGFSHCANHAHLQPIIAKFIDPRDPDPSRPGIFRDHNCAYCDSGKKPCRQGEPRNCEYPHARND